MAVENSELLVSCIMPTADRRALLPQAIRYFQRQDYPHRELIVLDDGADQVADLVPADLRIRYVRMDQKRTMGAKHNLACELARGEIIVHWDDDDWMSDWRLSYQVRSLLDQPRDTLNGLSHVLFWDPRLDLAWEYVYPACERPWVYGASFCYRRQFWERHRHPDMNEGADTVFVWGLQGATVLPLDNHEFYVALVHARNTSPKRPSGFAWRPFSAQNIRSLLGQDATFYEAWAGSPQTVKPMLRSGGTIELLDNKTLQHEAPTPAICPVAREPDNGNIFACLVHESQDCVIDLVRNLHFLDPSSLILLYNGGQDGQLLDSRFPFERYGAVVHPRPRPLAWGRLHEFALDCMQFALEHPPFRTLTIVDSDQLAVRPEYSSHLAAFLNGCTNVGMLVNSPVRQAPNTPIGPAQAAYKEIDLWRPFLRRFPEGESKFVSWSFWPSTVFTADAVKDLTRLFAGDRMLQEIVRRTKIWASEEVILPTVTGLLGYELVASPCSYDYVKYRTNYTVQQMQAAQARGDVFWVHPVPRRYNNPLRQHIRTSFGHYENGLAGGTMSTPERQPDSGLLLTWPILMRMRQIEGWLAEDEADLLIAATTMALTKLPKPHAVVEVGSYCGRSTVALGSVVKTFSLDARVYAIDPHDGKVGALDQGIQITPPTLEKLKRNLADAGLTDRVTILRAHSWEVAWDRPINLLFIDGLHDYANVAQDFYHFEPRLVPGAYVAFHDYADYYPGVKAFVNELLKSGRYQKVYCASSMMVVKRVPPCELSNLEDGRPASRIKVEECSSG